MSHVYDSNFYAYIEEGARSSARVVSRLLLEVISIRSVLDVGCGRGAWLDEWRKQGVESVAGIDGDYVLGGHLHIDATEFVAKNLREPFDLGEKFDLVQSLEVAEHLPESSAADFVESITKHGDMVLFSAATPGQGGEFHINEQPLSYWRDLFAARGYQAIDYLRPLLRRREDVSEWYRYNTLLYVNERASVRLPEAVRRAAIPPDQPVEELGSLRWRLRKAVVSVLPRKLVTAIARGNALRVSKS